MSKHTTLPTVARVISDTYELPYAQAYAAAVTEVVPGLVEVEVAVPRSAPAVR